ncbi:MAG: IS66 family transposase [Candidatus Uhrbacteria bacterium]|nr:IS66 family transposase [Candidatus Uhrbacteria bacterium]
MLASGRAEDLARTLISVVLDLRADVERKSNYISLLTRIAYGRKTERLSAEELGQLVLAFGGTEEQAAAPEPPVPVPEEPAAEPESKPKKRRPNHKGRTQLSPELERVESIVPVLDADRICGKCEAQMALIGHVTHERVEYVPGKFVVFVEKRETCACKKCDGDIKTAERETERSEVRAGASLLAHLVESKCDDALPIHRQQGQFSRLGFDVPVNTLYGYFRYVTELLSPVASILQSIVLGYPVVALDDTRLDVIDKSHPNGKYRGHLWCFVGSGPLISYAFTENWEAKEIEPWLESIDGFIQCDDYKGYDTQRIQPDGTVGHLVPHERRLGCMMHVRRRFHVAYEAKDLRAATPLEYIQKLYAIERDAKERGLDAKERLELRTRESLPILDDFDAWVDEQQLVVNPKSNLGRALGYAKRQREFIRRCFSDGRFEIDNGLVERTLRKPCVGRRNYLFTGSADGGRRLAVAYSLVQSCRALGINTSEYLVDVITKLQSGWPMRRIGELVPDRWAELRALAAASDQAAQ